jgi:fructan beta-fructosidase
MWYAPQKKWVMTLATKDDITFYSSPDLKRWKKESEFGKGVGAHGGVWECPDLIAFDDKGKQRWVLFVNMGSGGPNQGSGTQYFLGDFDGTNFVSDQREPRWLDYGPDDYAGVTWANTGDRKIFLGWMCSPHYAGQVPTEKWRSAMTLPRELGIRHVGNAVLLTSLPVRELSGIQSKPVLVENVKIDRARSVQQLTGKVEFPCRLDLDMEEIKDLSLVLSNDLGEKVVIGYDKNQNQYFIDRTQSGKVDFNKDFASRDVAPRLADSGKMKITLVIDVSSVELFADGGLTVMTEIFFPNKPFDNIQIESKDGALVRKLGYTGLKSIWP